jgi:hypothetical protein
MMPIFTFYPILFIIIFAFFGFLYNITPKNKLWIKGALIGLIISLILTYLDFSNMMYGMIVPYAHIPISLLLCTLIGTFIGYIYTKLKENQFLQKPYLLGLIIGVLTFGILYLLYLLPKITLVSMSSGVIFVDSLLWSPFRIIFGESALFGGMTAGDFFITPLGVACLLLMSIVLGSVIEYVGMRDKAQNYSKSNKIILLALGLILLIWTSVFTAGIIGYTGFSKPFICKTLISFDDRDKCPTNVAINLKDPNICFMASSPNDNWCLISTAEALSDSTICDSMSYLDNLPDKDLCYLRVAMFNNIASLCDKILYDVYEKNTCYHSVAVESGDPSLCSKASNTEESPKRDLCYIDLAQSKNDSSLCGSVENSEFRQECIDSIQPK